MRRASLLLCLLFACSDDDATSSQTDAGTPTLDARTSDVRMEASLRDDAQRAEAAVGPSGALGDGNALTACLTYVEEQCLRRLRCTGYGNYDNCQPFKQQCPDLLFSPGSTRTPAGIAACAQDWRKISCAELAVGVSPDCATPGSRALGEMCTFHSQCATQACSGSASSCGRCVEKLPLDGGAEESGPAFAGEQCDNIRGCVKGYLCKDGGRCVETVLGDPCGATTCASGQYCPRVSPQVCTALPRLGEACGDGVPRGAGYCAPGSYCADGKCAARFALGSRCSGANECSEDLQCLERDNNGFSTCLRVSDEGGSCGAVHERCARATACVDGTCREAGLQGFYAGSCTPTN